MPLVPGNEHCPSGLGELEDLLLLLWARGDAALLAGQTVAFVGARACTAHGAFITAELAAHAARSGATVLSGAAYGADRANPRGHDSLIGRITEEACVVSEAPPGAAPTQARFLARLRTIAALSSAVLAPEAAPRSRSLGGARTAALLGRPVGAVPGPVTSAASAGCPLLVQEGTARLVTSDEDVMRMLGQEGAQPWR